MQMVKINKLDYNLSKVAFGGVIVADESQTDANNYVAEAIDAGVNYFDVAPTYSNAEERLGPALKGKRKDIFLACKTEDRTRKGSQALLEKSLKNLQTDYFDLYQLHAVYNLADVERTFGPNGSFETYVKAKKEGYIKHIGFSAHSTEAALALMEYFDFDSIMFPFNFVSLIKNDYGSFVLKKALEKKMGIIGLKSMVLSERQESDVIDYPKAWYHPIENFELASKAVKYTFSRGVDVIIPPGNIAQFRWAIEIMKQYEIPLNKQDLDELSKIANATVPLFPLKKK